MPENIVSVITDGVVLFATSSVFWLASHPDSGNITKKILGKEKKLTEIMNNTVSSWISAISRNIAPGGHRLPCRPRPAPDGARAG